MNGLWYFEVWLSVLFRGKSLCVCVGFLESLDDFYVLDSKLVLLQTTNNVYNASLFDLVSPQSNLAWQRVRIANMMANTGRQWYKVFKMYNSGRCVMLLYSFIPDIYIVPLQVHYYSEALPIQHAYCVGVSPKRHRQLKDLPKVPTWRLERDSNPWPFRWKATNLPMSQHAPLIMCYNYNAL